MIIIPPSDDWISVLSAFGGLAIYRKSILPNARYVGALDNSPVCEHVPFHQAIVDNGGNIFINPSLINYIGVTSHGSLSTRTGLMRFVYLPILRSFIRSLLSR